MNILIVANHYAVCSARYATSAFERLGHTVRHVGPSMGRNIWGLTLPPGYEWEPDESMSVNYDLTLVMDSDPALLDIVREPGLAVVWGVDNHVRDYRRDWFNHYFLAHRHVSVMDWQMETPQAFVNRMSLESDVQITPEMVLPEHILYKDMTHLPCCYDPTLHMPSPIPFEERAYDVCMIGVMYPQRWAIVKALREAGFTVLAGTGLVGEAYRDAYHNARISLCISSNGDIGQRVYETAAMGCVVMMDNCADFEYAKPMGIWTLDGYEAADDRGKQAIVIQACKDILAEPEHAQQMVTLSQAWVSRETWDARAEKIIEWAARHTTGLGRGDRQSVPT